MFGERLRNKLDEEGISPAVFADQIGVNRSAVSHVLNNRNKPGFDFIKKIEKAFSDWDFAWLLFEKKTVEKTARSNAAPSTKKEDQQYEQAELFSERDLNRPSELVQKTVQKKLTKTILIYSDGTFEVYQNNF